MLLHGPWPELHASSSPQAAVAKERVLCSVPQPNKHHRSVAPCQLYPHLREDYWDASSNRFTLIERAIWPDEQHLAPAGDLPRRYASPKEGNLHSSVAGEHETASAA